MFRSDGLNNRINKLFACIMILYTIFIFVVIVYPTRVNMIKQAVQSSENVLSSISNGVLNEFKTVSTMSKMIMFSDEVIDYLTASEKDKYTASYRAVRRMYMVTSQFSGASSVFIFRTDGDYVNISDTIVTVDKDVLTDAKWKDKILQNSGGYTVMFNGNGLFIPSNDQPILSFVRVVNNPDNQREVGIMVVNYSMPSFGKMLNNFALQEKGIAIVDPMGDFLCGNEENGKQKLVTEQVRKNRQTNFSYITQNVIVCGHVIEKTPLVLVQYSELTSSNYFAEYPWMLIAAIVILSVICMVLIRFLIKVWIVHPIKKLVAAMKQSQEGRLRRVSLNTRISEMKNLKDNYNEMLVQINKLIDELVAKEKAEQQAKMEIMLEQLNPHFLYNTLETIESMALESPRDDIYEAVGSLANFYRCFLNNGNDLIKLQTEIQIVKDYLNIQKYRYGDIISDYYEIPPECMELYVPKLILQPLVENSLYHGIRPKGEKGIIRISARRDGTVLVLCVYDDGIGMSEEMLQQITNHEYRGFGLKKTIERLHTLYGRDKTFDIKSEEGIFCEIQLYLMAEKDDTNV